MWKKVSFIDFSFCRFSIKFANAGTVGRPTVIVNARNDILLLLENA